MTHHCPDDMTLTALFEGRLAPAERDALHGRMSGCADCQETLALIGLGLADEAAAEALANAPPPLEARARALYADLPGPIERSLGIAVRRARGALLSLADALAPTPMPALAVRGAEPDGALRYELDVGAPVELLLTEQAGQGTTVLVRVLEPPTPRSRVVLLRGGQVEASLALAPDGVRLSLRGVGRYALRFEVPGQADTVVPIDVSE